MAASIRAGFYTIGLAGGVETMSTNPMAWNGGVNPKLDQNQQAADCLLPMGAHCLQFHWGLLSCNCRPQGLSTRASMGSTEGPWLCADLTSWKSAMGQLATCRHLRVLACAFTEILTDARAAGQA